MELMMSRKPNKKILITDFERSEYLQAPEKSSGYKQFLIDFNGISTHEITLCLVIREFCTLYTKIKIFCVTSSEFFSMWLYDIKYSYLIQIYLTYR